MTDILLLISIHSKRCDDLFSLSSNFLLNILTEKNSFSNRKYVGNPTPNTRQFALFFLIFDLMAFPFFFSLLKFNQLISNMIFKQPMNIIHIE